MKIKIFNNKLIVRGAPLEMGGDFAFRYPQSYFDEMLGRPSYELIDKFAFTANPNGDWVFPTPQWIYPIMMAANSRGVKIENPEFLNQFKLDGGVLKNSYHLWEPQIECLNELTTYASGIAQLRTGFGKSEMIVVLAKNLVDQGKKVIVMAPSNGVLTEVKDRYGEIFDEDVKYYFNPEKMLQFVNPKGFFGSSYFKPEDPYWKDVDAVIYDEVEHCMNAGYLNAIKQIPRIPYHWSFSGTPRKTGGKLEFKRGDTFNDSDLNLFNMFGHTSFFSKPDDREIDLIKITPNIAIPLDMEAGNLFNQVQINLASSSYYHEVIEKLFIQGHLKNIYIPFTSRTAISEFTFRTERPVGLITGSGFEYRLGGTSEEFVKCTLEELKEIMREEKVEIVLSSVTGFKGIDFPNTWDSTMLNPIGNLASTQVQAMGRVSRAKKFKVFYIPGKGRIPVYSKHLTNGLKMMKDYYEKSKVNHINLKL